MASTVSTGLVSLQYQLCFTAVKFKLRHYRGRGEIASLRALRQWRGER